MDFGFKHPQWTARQPAWSMAQHHYEGGRSLYNHNDRAKPKYLKQFWTESPNDYQERLDRAMLLYDNLPRRALKVYQSQLFRVPPNRELPLHCKEEGEVDADLSGTSANSFFDRVLEMADLYGYYGVLVDAPRGRTDGQVVSEAAAQAEKVRPWFESVSPFSIIDWEVENSDPTRRGQFNYVVLHDEVTSGRAPMVAGAKSNRFRVYTPKDVTTYLVTGAGKQQQVSQEVVAHKFGAVPLVMFYSDATKPMESATIFDDIVLSANALWNTLSVMDEGFYYQGFNILTFASDQDISEIKLGERRGMRIPKDSSLTYTSPSGTPAEMGTARVQSIIERVNDLIFNRTQRQIPTAQVETAEKRELDRDEFVALLQQKAERAEKSEEKAWRLLATAWGENAADVDVSYNRTFNVDDRTAEEWMAECDEGISSKAEWYMRRHPAVTDEDKAWELIDENLKRNKAAGGASQERAANAELLRTQIAGPRPVPDAAEVDAEVPEEDEEAA